MTITDTHRHRVLPAALRAVPAKTRIRRVLRIAILALTTTALTLPALAENGSTITKKKRDKDITVIVIDDKDRHRKRVVDDRPRETDARGLIKRRKDKIRIYYDDDRKDRRVLTEPDDGRDPDAIISRSDDGTYVRTHRRKRDDVRHKGKSGPKIIVIDRSSSACTGSGVCVIRP